MTTTTMPELTGFLLSRIAEDEADPGCDGYDEYVICRDWSDRHVREAQAKRAILTLHCDDGESQGYLPDGSYGEYDHACRVCGTHGEYGVPWPCFTMRLPGSPRL